jgi:hypothetical protein
MDARATESSPWRILLSGILVLIGALVLARVVLLLPEALGRRTTTWDEQRISEMAEYLPKLPETAGPVVLFLGFSSVEGAIHPRTLDPGLRSAKGPVTSFNLAVRNVYNLIPVLIDRLVDDYTAAGRRVSVALVKITPGRMTVRAEQDSQPTEIQDATVGPLYSLRMYLNLVRQSPERAVQAFINVKVFGARSPLEVTGLVYRELTRRFDATIRDDREPARVQLRADRNWYSRRFQPTPAWSSKTRGGLRILIPANDSGVDGSRSTLHDPASAAEFLAYHNDCCDFTELHFSENKTRELVLAVQKLTAVADKVFLLYFPDDPPEPRSTEANARLTELLRSLQAQSGAEVLDYTATGGFETSDFYDHIHLNQRGSERLERLLTETLNRYFAAHDAPF